MKTKGGSPAKKDKSNTPISVESGSQASHQEAEALPLAQDKQIVESEEIVLDDDQ